MNSTVSGQNVSADGTADYFFNVSPDMFYQVEVIPVSGDPDVYGRSPASPMQPPVPASSGVRNHGFSARNGGGIPEKFSFASNYSGKYFLMVHGYSAATYSIRVRSFSLPTCTLISPTNAGIVWTIGEGASLQWHAPLPFDDYRIQLSHNGTTYTDLVTPVAGKYYSGGSPYAWNVEGPASTQCRAHVQGRFYMYSERTVPATIKTVYRDPANPPSGASANAFQIVEALTDDHLEIEGSAAVTEGTGSQYTCWKVYRNGSRENVTHSASWNVESGPGTIGYSTGYYSAPNVTQDTQCVIRARYSGMADRTKQVLVQDVPAPLSSIQIQGDTTPDENATTQYTCRAAYSDGSSKTVSGGVAWSVSVAPASATISTDGLLSTGDVAGDLPCMITAVYSGKTATLNTTIKDSVPAPPPAPSLLSPSHNAVTNTRPVTFRWNPVAGATAYHFRLDKVGGGWYENADAISGTVTQHSFNLPAIGAQPLYGFYVWKVKAANAPGNWGPWSPVRTLFFRSPENSGVNQENQEMSYDPINTFSGAYTYSKMDMKVAGRGMDFEFARFYNSKAVESPVQMAPKWRHTYQIALGEDAGNGSVVIHWANCTEDFFSPTGDGNYASTHGGYPGTLTKAGDGAFHFVTKSLLAYHFSPSGTLQRIEDRNGNVMTLGYDLGRLVSVMDTAGRSILFGYDGGGLLTGVTDFGAPTRTVSFTYDPGGNLETVTDVKGGITTYAYDPAYPDGHYLKTVTDPRPQVIVDNTYDSEGRVTGQTNANGRTWNYAYTPEGVTTELDAQEPVRGETRYTYNERSWLAKKERLVSPGVWITETYAYDDLGNRTEEVNPRGYYTRYTHDGRGNVLTVTRQHEGGDIVTSFEYNLTDQVTLVRDPLGRETRFEYDAKGNLVKVRKPLGHETLFQYDPLGQLLSETDPLGRVTAHVYDTFGNRTATINALGAATRFEYDALGRLARIIEPGPEGLEPATVFTYYADGAVESVTDQEGHTTYNSYDAAGNRALVRNPKGIETLYAHTPSNMLAEVIESATGRTTETAYDPVDRVMAVKDRWNKTSGFEYDLAGRRAKVVAPDAAESIFAHDANGKLTAVTNANGHTFTTVYDDLDRPVKTTDPLGNTVENTYDAAGRLAAVKDANGKETAYVYDDLNRLVEIRDQLNGTLAFVYDLNGNRLSITDPNSNTTRFEYDALNRITAESDAAGKGFRYTYDTNGNLLTRLDTRSNTTIYAYYRDHRLKTVTYPDSTTVSFTYDANGNRLTMADANGTTTWAYDDLDRITGVTDPFGNAVGYAYDQTDDIRRRITYPGGRNVDYAFDANGRLASLTDWAGHTFTYGYYPDGSVKELAYPNGCVEKRAYYANERLHTLAHEKAGGETIVSYTYYYDKNGNVTGMDRRDAVPREFQAELTNYSYNSANEIRTAGDKAFAFDASGNQASENGPGGKTEYVYDYENRLTALDPPGADAFQFLYNGLGDRLQSMENGTPKRYLLDINKGLTDVLADLDSSNVPQQYYLYGLGLVGRITPSGDLYNYHSDHIGSIMAVTDQTSAVTGAFAYDEFGGITGQSGGEEGPWRFCGAIGLQDHERFLFARARYYEHQIGRLVHKDPVANLTSTQVANPFSYVGNSPLVATDPSGQVVVWEDSTKMHMYTSLYGSNTYSTIYDFLDSSSHKIRIEFAIQSQQEKKDGKLGNYTPKTDVIRILTDNEGNPISDRYTLAHELFHAFDDMTGQLSLELTGGSRLFWWELSPPIYYAEVRATRAENQVRRELGDTRMKIKYGKTYVEGYDEGLDILDEIEEYNYRKKQADGILIGLCDVFMEAYK